MRHEGQLSDILENGIGNKRRLEYFIQIIKDIVSEAWSRGRAKRRRLDSFEILNYRRRLKILERRGHIIGHI